MSEPAHDICCGANWNVPIAGLSCHSDIGSHVVDWFQFALLYRLLSYAAFGPSHVEKFCRSLVPLTEYRESAQCRVVDPLYALASGEHWLFSVSCALDISRLVTYRRRCDENSTPQCWQSTSCGLASWLGGRPELGDCELTIFSVKGGDGRSGGIEIKGWESEWLEPGLSKGATGPGANMKSLWRAWLSCSVSGCTRSSSWSLLPKRDTSKKSSEFSGSHPK